MSDPAEPSSSTAASLKPIKEALEKMLQTIQDELRKVDSEWTQMCSVAATEMKEKETESSTVAEKCAVVNAAILDDPDVVNNMELQL